MNRLTTIATKKFSELDFEFRMEHKDSDKNLWQTTIRIKVNMTKLEVAMHTNNLRKITSQ